MDFFCQTLCDALSEWLILIKINARQKLRIVTAQDIEFSQSF